MKTPSTTALARCARAKAALYVTVTVMFFAASAAPTPLYRIYQQLWGFSATTLTAIFGAYACGLLAALLTTGTLSDCIGRKKVILGAIALELQSLLAFLSAHDVAMLFVARLVQGFATGVAVSALGAAIVDAQPQHGALLNSISPVFGMGIGALASSALLDGTHPPLHLAYWICSILFILLAFCCLLVKESTATRPFTFGLLKPVIAIPRLARAPMLHTAPANMAIWALNGFYLSLGPSLAREVFASNRPLTGGFAVFVLTMGAVSAIALCRQLASARLLNLGIGFLCSGLLLTLAAVTANNPMLFLCGSALAGAGFGTVLQGCLRTLLPLAGEHGRAGLLAGFYVISYVAFSVPSLLAGSASQRYGLRPVSNVYATCLLLLALITLTLMAFERLRTRNTTKVMTRLPD